MCTSLTLCDYLSRCSKHSLKGLETPLYHPLNLVSEKKGIPGTERLLGGMSLGNVNLGRSAEAGENGLVFGYLQLD